MFVYTSKNGFTWANELGFCYVLDEFVSPCSAILTRGKDMKTSNSKHQVAISLRSGEVK